MDVDTGIRISVVPSQSAYFAGEPFSVSVTFTNTRSPMQAAKRTVSHQSHKRAVHSISSAPLARPPTSPITPRTAVPSIVSPPRDATKTKKKYERKGLIGIPTKDDNAGKRNGSRPLIEQWSGKSYSTTLSPQDISTALSTPSASSPLRDGSLPANHPHARKQSLQDGQLDAQLNVRELSSPAPVPSSTSASTSAFSLSLDTISEHSPETHPYPPKRRPPNLGLGIGPLAPLGPGEHKPPHTAYASSTFTQPGTELVLYAYAQLSGTVTLGGDTTQTDTRAQTQALNAVRFALQRKQAFGGGRMDISSMLDSSKSGDTSARRRSHGRAVSLSSSIMSLLAPPPATPSQKQWTPGHKPRTPSLIASFITPSASSPASIGASGTTDWSEEVPPETPLPVFEVQPSMLAVDLVLAPGESRTYKYSLPLPDNLPPTYRGRIIKFAYQLSVGVCRATPGPSLSPSSPSGKGSTSQVMRVPIRVYNHVDVSGVQKPYDLLWPILHPPSKEQTAQVCEMTTSHGGGGSPGIGRKVPGTNSLAVKRLATSPASSTSTPSNGSVGALDPALELRNYAQRLLDACADPSGSGLRAPIEIEALSPTAEAERELRARGNGELTGCREAVEILTRNMRKVSYDVNKDGVKVAVLTFTKSAYRLGETVVGVVELNELASRARVLKLSAMLEAHETLPSSLNPSSSSLGSQAQAQHTKKLRKLHAEYHASLTLSTLRTSFALDIPSDATPAFQYVCAPPTFWPSTSAISLSSPRSSSSSLHSHSSSIDALHAIPVSKSSNHPSASDSNPTPNMNTTPTPGGLTWTVRLCLLVGVASPYARKGLSGARVKGLVQDGPHGEWGTSWRATRGIAPLQNVDLKAVRRAETRASRSRSSNGKGGKNGDGKDKKGGVEGGGGGGWASYFSSFLSGSEERKYHDGDEYLSSSSSQSSSPSHSRSGSPSPYLDGVRNGSIDETRTIRPGPPAAPVPHTNLSSPTSPISKNKRDASAVAGIDLDPGGGEDGWSELRAETVECEIPVSVWPGNTAFKPMEVVFEV